MVLAMNRCPNCNAKWLAVQQFPVHCSCGSVFKEDSGFAIQPPDTRGHDKAAICRTNKCGRYDSETDTCGVLVDRGKRGAIAWLYSNPDAKCVADPPMWTDDDDDGSNSDGLESRKD